MSQPFFKESDSDFTVQSGYDVVSHFGAASEMFKDQPMITLDKANRMVAEFLNKGTVVSCKSIHGGLWDERIGGYDPKENTHVALLLNIEPIERDSAEKIVEDLLAAHIICSRSCMIPPTLLAEAEAQLGTNPKHERYRDGFRDAVEWTFTRLCEMSEADWTVELTNAALDAGSKPISDPLNTTVAFVNGARHQYALSAAALLKAKEEIARLHGLVGSVAGSIAGSYEEKLRVKKSLWNAKSKDPILKLDLPLHESLQKQLEAERARCERMEKEIEHLKCVVKNFENSYELERTRNKR